jgi:hypothetical protein
MIRYKIFWRYILTYVARPFEEVQYWKVIIIKDIIRVHQAYRND